MQMVLDSTRMTSIKSQRSTVGGNTVGVEACNHLLDKNVVRLEAEPIHDCHQLPWSDAAVSVLVHHRECHSQLCTHQIYTHTHTHTPELLQQTFEPSNLANLRRFQKPSNLYDSVHPRHNPLKEFKADEPCNSPKAIIVYFFIPQSKCRPDLHFTEETSQTSMCVYDQSQ